MKESAFAYYGFLLAIIITGCSKSDPVQMVKSGTLEVDKSVTVGNALDGYKYFADKKWTSFEDDQKRTIVQFEATFAQEKYVNLKVEDYEIVTAEKLQKDKAEIPDLACKFVVQFNVSADGKSFDLGAVASKVTGTDIKTGKSFDQDAPGDASKDFLSIYQNQPAASVALVLLNAESE